MTNNVSGGTLNLSQSVLVFGPACPQRLSPYQALSLTVKSLLTSPTVAGILQNSAVWLC